MEAYEISGAEKFGYQEGDPRATLTTSTKRNKSRTKLRKPKLPEPKRISNTTPGTLAYAFSCNGMDNPTVLSYLQHMQEEDPRLQSLLADYELLDDREKDSAVIWDKLARKHLIPVGKLYGRIAEASLQFGRAMTYHVLATHEPEVAESLAKSAKIRKNLEHTRLFLETSGAIGQKGNGVNINLNQHNDNRSLTIQGLPQQVSTTVKEPLARVREAQQQLLTSGETEFIDVEVEVGVKGVEIPDAKVPNNS